MMASSDYAMVASGTAALECALLETPLSVVWANSPFNYQFASSYIKSPYISLPNLIAGKKIVEEYVQYFSYDQVSQEILDCLQNPSHQEKKKSNLQTLQKKLRGNAPENVVKVIRDMRQF